MDILPPALFLLSLRLFFQSCVFLVCLPKNPLFINALTFSYLITSDFLGSPTNHWSSCSIYIWVMIVDSVTKPPRCSISGNYVLVEKRSLQWHKGCWCNPTQMHTSKWDPQTNPLWPGDMDNNTSIIFLKERTFWLHITSHCFQENCPRTPPPPPLPATHTHRTRR